MATFLTDTFTDEDETNLTAHTSDSGAGWVNHPGGSGVYVITGNQARCTTAGLIYCDAVPPSADYTVEVDLTKSVAGGNLGFTARMSASAATFYMVRANSNGDVLDLYRCVTGTFTLLDSAPLAAGTYTVRLVLAGSTQSVYVDDVLTLEGTDSAITDAGHIGMRESGLVGNYRIDNLTAYTATAAAAAIKIKAGGSVADAIGYKLKSGGALVDVTIGERTP